MLRRSLHCLFFQSCYHNHQLYQNKNIKDYNILTYQILYFLQHSHNTQRLYFCDCLTLSAQRLDQWLKLFLNNRYNFHNVFLFLHLSFLLFQTVLIFHHIHLNVYGVYIYPILYLAVHYHNTRLLYFLGYQTSSTQILAQGLKLFCCYHRIALYNILIYYNLFLN